MELARKPATVIQKDVVFIFSSVTWDDAQQRMCHPVDRLSLGLLGHASVRRLLIANPYRSWPIRIARRMRGYRSAPFPTSDAHALYQPFRLRRSEPRRIDALERSYRAYSRRLRSAVARAGLDAPFVVVANPLAAAFTPFDWASGVAFFAEDDWAAAPTFRPWWPAIEDAYRRISANGMAVGAVTTAIIDRIAPSGPHAVIPNGVEPREWWDAASPSSWLAALPRPRILYLGVINERLDVEAVRAIAGTFQSGSIALVGEVTDEAHVAPLRTLPNVHFHPRVPRVRIPEMVGAADVGIVPHLVTKLTQAMSPLKVYEYLAAGRPVAATALDPIRGIDDRVVLVRSGGDFPSCVAAAAALGPAAEERRRAFIAANSWDRRVDAVVEFVLGLVGPSASSSPPPHVASV